MKRKDVIEKGNLLDYNNYMLDHKRDKGIREEFVKFIFNKVKFDGFYVGDGSFFDYNESFLLSDILVNKQEYNLSDEVIDKIINILTSSKKYNGKEKIIEYLLDSEEFYTTYGEKLVHSGRNLFLQEKKLKKLTNLFVTDIELKRTFDANVSHYSINEYVDDVLELYNTDMTDEEKIDFKNKLYEFLDYIYVTLEIYTKMDYNSLKEVFLPLFQLFDNDELLKISQIEYSKLTDIFNLLNFDNIDVKTFNEFLKNDYKYNNMKYSYDERVKINNIINNHVIANKDKINLEGIGELYNILKITGEKKELLNLVLDTNDLKEIKDIFNDNLSSKESVMLLDNAINENNAFLAYNLLLNSNIIFMNKKDKKILEKIILESKDLKLIAKYALYINNNLINPIFGSIDNLYAYINKDNEIKVNKKDKKQYIKIKQKEIANKNNSKKKYVKALDLYLNNQKK